MRPSHILAALSAVVTLTIHTGCSSELDTNAPYKRITVVYSLLNKNDNIHWVKINKAFLGEGDAFVYAQIPDSTEYTEEQLPESARRIEKIDANGNVIPVHPDSLRLRDTIVDRPDGIFHGPAHKMYYFYGDMPGGRLDKDARYRLVLEPQGSEVITAETPLVDSLAVRQTLSDPDVALSFYLGNGYQPYAVRWYTSHNARRYQAYYRFHYDEVRNGQVETKYFDNQIGTLVSDNQTGGEVSLNLNSETFYQAVANNVRYTDQSVEDQVESRIFRGVEFYFWLAAPQLHTYLQLASPISGIVEERPDYSNINGGFGLMSSRMYRIVPDEAQGGNVAQRKRLTSASSEQLMNGQYTGGLKFCVPTPLDGGC